MTEEILLHFRDYCKLTVFCDIIIYFNTIILKSIFNINFVAVFGYLSNSYFCVEIRV